MLRILLAESFGKSLTFSPIRGGKYEDYAFYRGGEQINDVFTLDDVLAELDIEPVYTTYARCKAAGGWSNREAFDTVKERFLKGSTMRVIWMGYVSSYMALTRWKAWAAVKKTLSYLFAKKLVTIC